MAERHSAPGQDGDRPQAAAGLTPGGHHGEGGVRHKTGSVLRGGGQGGRPLQMDVSHFMFCSTAGEWVATANPVFPNSWWQRGRLARLWHTKYGSALAPRCAHEIASFLSRGRESI